jgi:hypothetical protein
MKERIFKPIFIVGCGRSGTTIFNNTLSWHKDLAWISNYSNRLYPAFPASALSCKFYRSKLAKRLLGKLLPRPVEGYNLWNWCHPVVNSPNDPPLIDIDVSEESLSRCRILVNDHLRFSCKKRFVNKNTRNSRRIRYLNKVFPDALFIHILRDGRAVVASLLNVKWHKSHRLWITDESESTMPINNISKPLQMAAKLWQREVERILEDKNYLDGDRFLQIKYEDFVSTPILTMMEVCEFCNLDWSAEFEQYINSINLKNMNYRFNKRLTRDQITKLNSDIKPLAEKLGYNSGNLDD